MGETFRRAQWPVGVELATSIELLGIIVNINLVATSHPYRNQTAFTRVDNPVQTPLPALNPARLATTEHWTAVRMRGIAWI
jgi:hypothetical protein